MVRVCERCGAPFETPGGKARYCFGCRAEIKVESNKARKGMGTIHNCDSAERIAICLSCTVSSKRCTGNCEKIRTAASKWERKR